MNNSGDESLQVAYSIAHGEGFANPFRNLPSGPTAHLAPVFPFLLSFVIRWFGDGSRALYVIDWMGVVATALQLSLWPFAAARLRMGFFSGVLAAGLWLLAGFMPNTLWEADYVAVLVLLVTIGTYDILTTHCSSRHTVLIAGLWGFTLLSSPSVLVSFIVFSIWTILWSPATAKQKLIFVVVPLAVLTPWMVRNYVTFHHIVLVRGNLGLELSDSNNECSEFSLAANQDDQCYFSPNEDPKEAQRLRVLGEYDYNHARLSEALSWIAGNPARFARLTFQRFVAFWFPNGSGNPFTSSVATSVKVLWMITLVSIPGLLLLWWKSRVAAGMILVWLITFPLVYYLVAFDARYRTPIIWATLIPASFLIVHAATELMGRTER